MKCPHCNNTHANEMEQKLCPMRPEQLPLMIEQFGSLASHSDFHVTDRIRYTSPTNGKERIGVVLWVVAPGASGTQIEPSDKLRYIAEPFDLSVPFGFADEFAVVSAEEVSHVHPQR